MLVSALFHVFVLVSLLQVASIAPERMRLEVFAADPVEATPEPMVEPAPPPSLPPRQVTPRPARPAQPGRSPTGAKPASVRPPAALPPTSAVAAATSPPKLVQAQPVAPVSQTPQRAEVEAASGPVAADTPKHGNSAAPSRSVVEAEVEGPRAVEVPAQGPAPAPSPVPATPLQPVAAVAPPPVPAPESIPEERAPVPAPEAVTVAQPDVAPPPAPSPVSVVQETLPAVSIPAPAQPSTSEPPSPPTSGRAAPSRSTAVAPGSPAPGPVVRAETQRPSASGAASGLGLGRLQIRLDGARARTTDQETDIISGTLIGGTPARLVVQVDDRMTEPKVDGRTFSASVKLVPGLNRVRVVATDAQGVDVEEVVAVDYVPPVEVALTNPRDGLSMTPDDPPLVDVQGQVSDAKVTTVWIVSNDRRVAVPVTAGKFRHVLPVFEPSMRIRAETDAERRTSPTVTVHSAAAMPAIGLSLHDWPRQLAGLAQVTVTWRPNPARLEGSARALPVRGVLPAGSEPGPEFFYLRDARPGVYTFVLTYRGGAATAVRPELYVAGAARALRPVTLDASGRAVIARLLLPQGVLWEQDDWFTGRSANGDTVTKFRFPDGVSWTERVGDPVR
jgi:hypothetical protein